MENFSKVSKMNALVETRTSFRMFVDVVWRELPKQIGVFRASLEVGVNERRGKAFYYGEARRVDGDELDRIREVKARYADQFESQATRLEAVDPEMFGPDIARLRGQAQRLRNLAG